MSNSEVLTRASAQRMFTVLSERRLRWLGHVKRMSPGRILKDLLYGELVSGKRKTGRPHLRYKDVCQRDMRAASINATGSGKQRIDPPGALLSGRGKNSRGKKDGGDCR